MIDFAYTLTDPPANALFLPRNLIRRSPQTGIRELPSEVRYWCMQNLRAGWRFTVVPYGLDAHERKVFKPGIEFDDDVDMVMFKMYWL